LDQRWLSEQHCLSEQLSLSEQLRPKQGIDEVEHEPRGHETGERIVEDHGTCPYSRSQAMVYPTDRAKKARPRANMMMSIICMLLAVGGKARRHSRVLGQRDF
jgi:hypothetical protein